MRQFVISEAQASRVARHVREAVEDEGGIVADHTAHETEFDHLDYGDQAWRRAGYVGTYERFKEKPVQVRIRVWAQWPRRLLLSSVYLGFAVAVLFFLASLVGIAIPPNVWIFTSLPILAAVALSFLLYTSSIPDSEGAEEHIETKLAERVAEDDAIPGAVYDVDAWENHRERLIEEAKEDARERVPHGGSSVKKALASASSTLGGSSQAEADEETDEEGFLDRVRQDSDVEGDEDDTSLADRVPGLGSSDDEPEGEELEAEEDEASEDAENESSLTDKLPFGGSSDEDEPEDEDLEAEETDDSSFTDKLPFGSSSDEEDDPGQAEDEEDEGPGLGEKLTSAVPGLGNEDEDPTEEEAPAEADEAEDEASRD